MKGRLPLLLVLGSSFAFLASLYVPWVTSSSHELTFGSTGPGALSLLNLLSQHPAYAVDGWGGLGFGEAAALCALAVAAGSAALLLRPQTVFRAPVVAGCALSFLFFAGIAAAEAWVQGVFVGTYQRLAIHLGIGAHVGLACAVIAVATVAQLYANDLVRRPAPTELVATALTLGVLASFLVPLLTYRVPHLSFSAPGFQSVPGVRTAITVGAGAIACFSLPLWRLKQPWIPLFASASLVLLAFARPSGTGISHWRYPAWLDVGCSLALLGLAAWTARRAPRRRPALSETATVVAASFLLVSLFLPWQEGFLSGWDHWHSAMAGVLAIGLILSLVAGQARTELAIAAALAVMSTGLSASPYGDLRYGAFLGFAASALLLLTAAFAVRRAATGGSVIRLAPIAACLALLAFAVPASTDVVPTTTFELQSPWRWLYLLDTAVIVLTLRLLLRWTSRPRDFAEVVVLPLALLALTVLDLLEIRRTGVSWEGWASVVLCVLLAALGWIERYRGGLRLRIPEEIWRIDRISTGEN